ncbi:hypothetical protein [Halorubrum trueperi]|uniref:Uncharacterized protein n=1 Tax=Halorubrum trueperi TaxID=2004704 RepID=A0ABD5ULF4_9EURY
MSHDTNDETGVAGFDGSDIPAPTTDSGTFVLDHEISATTDATSEAAR